MPGAYGEAKVNVSGYDPPPKKKMDRHSMRNSPAAVKGGNNRVFRSKIRPPTQRFAVDSLPLAQEIALALAPG